MSFDTLDPRLFSAFVHAADSGNFTLAAERAAMTQSGISQHIAKLEEQIGLPLFERINKKVLLTSAGRDFRLYIDDYAERMGAFLEEVKGKQARPGGLVRYAMPASCLKTPHLSRLLEKRRDFPLVTLEIRLADSTEIFARLLAGEIDFGFVTIESDNPAVFHRAFAQEEYVLVSNRENQLRQLRPEDISGLPFVDYPGMGALFNIWRKHLYPRHERISEGILNVVGRINDLDGAIKMVLHGVGFTIIPRHCGDPFWKQKALVAYEPKSPPVGTIYLITRTGSQPSRRVDWVIRTFFDMK